MRVTLYIRLVLGAMLSGACSLVVDSAGLTGGRDASAAPQETADSGTPTRIAKDAEADANEDTDAGFTDAGLVAFRDDFARADGDVLGNGWTEKNPAAFSISNGRARKAATSLTYCDNLVTRPASEDQRDVEVTVEIDGVTPDTYPQIFMRAQRSSIDMPDGYEGYLFYLSGAAPEAILGRQRGTQFVTTLSSLTITPPLDASKRYRMTASVRGDVNVELSLKLERQDGMLWVTQGEKSVFDATPDRIQGAGALGFSANEQAGPTYDNFTWRHF